MSINLVFALLLSAFICILCPTYAFAAPKDTQTQSVTMPVLTKSTTSQSTNISSYNPQREIKEATNLLSRNPRDAIAYERRGAAYNRLEMWTEAISDLNSAIKLAPPTATAFFHRGLAYYKLQKYPQALADLTVAIRLNPSLAPAYACRANLYTSTKKYQLAIQDARKALRLDPKDPANHLALSRAEYYVGQHKASIQSCTQAIKLNPKASVAWDNRGVAYLQARQFVNAISDFTTAIKLKDNEAKYYCHRGIVYLEIGNYDSAIKDLSQSINLKSDYSLALFDRGVSYFRMGKYDLAHKDITTAIYYDPHYALAWEELPLDPTKLPQHKDAMNEPRDWYYRATDRILLKRNENAIDDLEKYLELAGWKAEFSQNAAILLYLGFKHNFQDAQANAILDQAIEKCDKGKWPYPVIAFLHHNSKEEELIKQASTDDEKTEAKSLIALHYLFSQNIDKAVSYLNWVESNGHGSTMAYSLARREIEKLHPTKTLNTERFYERSLQ